MALLALADTMDSTKALFQPVGIPRKVIVHHQVRPLEIDALASGVGCNEDDHLGVVIEGLLDLIAFQWFGMVL